MATFWRWCTCPGCEGTGRVNEHLKGANVLVIGGKSCNRCWGLGEVKRRMTRQEVIDALGPNESAPPQAPAEPAANA